MSKIVIGSVLLVLGLGLLANAAGGGEQLVFPIGLLFMDNMSKPEEGCPFDMPAEALVDLRSRGIEVTGLSGTYAWSHGDAACQIVFQWVMEDVDALAKKLARADSFGLLVYGSPRTFDDALRRYGHDALTVPDSVYFRYYYGQDLHRYTESVFRDSLEHWVSWVVDSLNARLEGDSVQSLYRYLFWDEPFGKHLGYVQTSDKWDDYWMNIWEHDDVTGWHTDSRGVGSLLKYEIEQKDTMHSVWFNNDGNPFHEGKNPVRGLCSLMVDTLGPAPIPNPIH
jgi:hypothetical protein